nr:Hsp70 family protein [Protofrankia sp. BMG5.30]
METPGGFHEIIGPGTVVPIRRSGTFTTVEDGQTAIAVHVLEVLPSGKAGVRHQRLALLELVNLPREPRGIPRVEVSFEVDAGGTLRVDARELATGQERSATVGLSETRKETRRTVRLRTVENLPTPVEPTGVVHGE